MLRSWEVEECRWICLWLRILSGSNEGSGLKRSLRSGRPVRRTWHHLSQGFISSVPSTFGGTKNSWKVEGLSCVLYDVQPHPWPPPACHSVMIIKNVPNDHQVITNDPHGGKVSYD